MKKTLEAILSHGPVSIYTNQLDTSSFWAGYVVGMDEQFVLLHQLDENGYDDGYGLRLINDIYMIETDTPYLEMLQQLRNTKHEIKELPEISTTSPLLMSLITYAYNYHFCVSIESFSSGEYDVQGLIVDIDDDVVKILQLDAYGCRNGYSYIDIDSISRIDCNSSSEKRLNILYHLKNK